jgi:hypothetical protein
VPLAKLELLFGSRERKIPEMYQTQVVMSPSRRNEVWQASIQSGLAFVPGFVSNFLLIQAATNPTDRANDLRSLQVIGSYMCAFFDKYLKQEKSTLLDENSSKDPEVEIKRYGPVSALQKSP